MHVNFAPVADVNTNPHNPVIGVRSFGADPELVARHVAAFVRGTQRQGVAACAKHFPGHGDTAVDSHLDLPVVAGDLEAALLPFRAAIAAGVKAVMTGHLVVPGLDELPATLSRRIITGLLREELGFDGLVVTDALEMRAISGGVGVEEAGVQALAAGVDALCVGHDLHEETVDATHRCDLRGRAVGSPAAGAARGGGGSGGRDGEVGSSRRPAGAPGREVGGEAARRALRIHGSPTLERDPLVVELVPQANIAAGEFAHGLADLWPGALGVRLDGSTRDASSAPAGDDRPLVIVARDALRHDWQQAIIWELLTLRPDAVVIETGIRAEPTRRSRRYGAGRANLEAARDVLAARV